MWGRRAIWQRKFGSRPNLQAQSAFLGASWVYGPDCKPQRTFRGQPPQAALRPRSRLPPRRPCGLSCGLGVSDPSPQAPPFRAGCRFFPKLRTCIHNQRMPDGRGILLPCKAKKRRQYFVYCKIFQRGRPAKDPLRRCRMVVNTGSKSLFRILSMQGGLFSCNKPPLAASRQFTEKSASPDKVFGAHLALRARLRRVALETLRCGSQCGARRGLCPSTPQFFEKN